MVQFAMADAVVSIRGQYEPFHAKVPAPPSANARAAAAQAAHDVLVALFPANTAELDAALYMTLQSIPQDRRWPGRTIGKNAAAQVLAWRANDGFADANPQPPTILPSLLPGIRAGLREQPGVGRHSLPLRDRCQRAQLHPGRGLRVRPVHGAAVGSQVRSGQTTPAV